MAKVGIRMSYLCVSAEVRRQIRVLLVWRGAGCGGGLPVRRHSHGGHRVELWRAFDWLKNDKKQLKVNQSRQTRVYLGFIRPKIGTMRFGPTAGFVGCAFDLIVECTCFWSQTDQVYLFLAAALMLTIRTFLPFWPGIGCLRRIWLG